MGILIPFLHKLSTFMGILGFHIVPLLPSFPASGTNMTLYQGPIAKQ